MRLDTGGGKTVVLGWLVENHPGASCVIAHRQELVGQLSLTLARYGIRHNIIAAKDTIKAIVALHILETGRSFYDPGARCAVASVDTLVKAKGLEAWAAQVTLWIVDEAHHLVRDNKWHSAISMFTNPYCHGLGPTATPNRTDGRGLGAHADGVFHAMVQGPPMRWLIDQGYLTDYRVFIVESDIVRLLGEVGPSGDYSQAQLKNASDKSHIVGDVVSSYLKFVPGKSAITFTTDVDTCARVSLAARKGGIRAEALTGKTDGGVRRQMLQQLANGGLDEIIAVDIVSEGFDLPAIQAGIAGRPSESLQLYMQQIGRILRPIYAAGYDLETQAGRLAAIAAGPKPIAFWIDHVGNFLRHGPPDRPRFWTLDSREKRGRNSDAIPMRGCENEGCFQPYEAFRVRCPHCGHKPEPAGRSTPKQVAGDLAELDPEILAKLRAGIEEADMGFEEYRVKLTATGLPARYVAANVNALADKQEAQARLRAAMALWGGARLAEGLTDREMQKLFFLRYGVDVMSAQALNRADADALHARLTGPST
jgi:DNA repair protein RadD